MLHCYSVLAVEVTIHFDLPQVQQLWQERSPDRVRLCHLLGEAILQVCHDDYHDDDVMNVMLVMMVVTMIMVIMTLVIMVIMNIMKHGQPEWPRQSDIAWTIVFYSLV